MLGKMLGGVNVERGYIPSNEDDSNGTDTLIKKVEPIVVFIRNVGIVVIVISLMLIGIRIMTSSIDEKSKLKEALPGYIFGVFLVVAVTVIPSLIFELAKSINKN